MEAVRSFGWVVMIENTVCSISGPFFFDRSEILPPQTGKREQRPRLVPVDREPMPGRRLRTLRFGIACRRHEAAPRQERVAPERIAAHLVITGVDHAARRLSASRRTNPQLIHEFALTIISEADDGRKLAWKDGVSRSPIRSAHRLLLTWSATGAGRIWRDISQKPVAQQASASIA